MRERGLVGIETFPRGREPFRRQAGVAVEPHRHLVASAGESLLSQLATEPLKDSWTILDLHKVEPAVLCERVLLKVERVEGELDL